MSFKTALASCWDVCKRNCTIDSIYYPFSYTNGSYSYPEFTLRPYETYSEFDKGPIPFPYNEKPCEKHIYNDNSHSYNAGLTEPEDKLVSSFVGWIFTIPEMLFWSTVTLGKALLAIFLFLGLTLSILAAPIVLPLLPFLGLGYFLKYKQVVKELAEYLGSTCAFTVLALLQVPYHALKAIIRIPVGVGLAIKELVSPTPLPALQSTTNSSSIIFDEAFVEELNQIFSAGNRAFEQRQLLQQNDRRYEEMSEEDSVEELNSTFSNEDQALEERLQRLERQFEEILRELRELQLRAGFEDDFSTSQTNSFNTLSSPTIHVSKEKNLWQDCVDNLNFTDLPKRYTCPVSYALMNQAFLLVDGHLYNKMTIDIHLERSNKSPFNNNLLPETDQSGIVLNSVQQEVASFVIALRANDYLARITGEDPVERQKAVLKIAENASKTAETFQENISRYIRNRKGEENSVLADKILKDPKLAQISVKAITTAFQYIQTTIGIQNDLAINHSTKPVEAMEEFLKFIACLDNSYDNFIITALQEAMMEEQQISKQFDASWQFEKLEKDKWFENLQACIPEVKPDHFDGIIRAIQKNSAISIRALQYTLELIKDPQNAGSFAQFQAKSNNLVPVIKNFLEAYYDADNEPFKTVFLMTLKETILAEEQSLEKSSDLPNAASINACGGFSPVFPVQKEVKVAENLAPNVSTDSHTISPGSP